MFCRKCGILIPDDSCFCPKCGTRVVTQKQGAMSFQKTQTPKCIESCNNGDGNLLRDIALLIGGLVAAWIGYAMWIGSTISVYLSTKSMDYHAMFRQNAPNVAQWMVGVCGSLVNIAGAICIYMAICPLSQRFSVWRRQNKLIGTILAIVICLVVFVALALKTSATGSFGIWDYLIMAAIFGGMWQGGRQTNGEVDNRTTQTRSQSRNAGRSVETRGYLIGTFAVIFFIGVFLFLRFAMSSRDTPIDEHVAKVALAAWLSDGADNTLRVALRKHGLERDPSLKGYKAKEPGGWRDLVRRNKPEKYATDHLIQAALLSGFSRKLIEQAKEESQGDPATMYDFFAERAEVRLKDMVDKNAQSPSRNSTTD